MLKKSLFVSLMFLPCLIPPLQAANETEIIKNDYAKVSILRQVYGGASASISADNKYVAGGIMPDFGFVYDIANDSVHRYNGMYIKSVVSPQHFYASCPEYPLSLMYKDSVKTLFEWPNSGTDVEAGITIYGASEDRTKIVGGAYDGNRLPSAKPGMLNFYYGIVYNGGDCKIERWLKPHWPLNDPPVASDANLGYGSRANAVSGDGTVAMGQSCKPGLEASTSPTFWDISNPNPDSTFSFGIEGANFCMSELYASTYNGSIIVGGSVSASLGIIAYYDKANRSFYKLDTIAPILGFSQLHFNAITEDTLIFGVTEMVANPGTRTAIVYSRATGLVLLKDYLLENYDLNLNGIELSYVTQASKDGKVVTGILSPAGPSWVLELGDQIMQRARRIIARTVANTMNVFIEWQRPMAGKNALIGYNIYRDESTKINTELVSANAISYTDIGVDPGEHRYSIEAVYENNVVAGKRVSNKVLVLEAGTSYPVQELNSRFEFNKYVSLYWGTPSSIVLEDDTVASETKIKKGEADIVSSTELPSLSVDNTSKKSFENTTMEYLSSVDMEMYTSYSGIKIGDSSYVASHTELGIKIYDNFNNRVGQLKPEGLGVVYSMVYLDNKLYCGSKKMIYVIDLTSKTISNRIPVPDGRHLAYIPTLNGGRGGFEVGGARSSFYYTLSGDSIGVSGYDFSKLGVTGTACYGNKLYVASQTGKYRNEIYIYDTATKQPIGKPVQPEEDVALFEFFAGKGAFELPFDGAVAGGLSMNYFADGSVALGEVMQCTYTTGRFMLFEIKGSDDLLGYNIYRDGVKLNSDPMPSRRYKDDLKAEGMYVYSVKPVTTTGTSTTEPTDTIIIGPKGNCVRPAALKVIETNGFAVVSWALDPATTNLVGFNVYRDGDSLGNFWLRDMRTSYVDKDVTMGRHIYRVEGFYGTACTASDSVEITITHEGTVNPPLGLQLSFEKTAVKKQYNVNSVWETPMFEEPLAIKYGNGMPATSIGFLEGVTEAWIAIGWDTNGLELYKDLYIAGIEFLPGENNINLDGFVFLNNEMVYTKDYGRVRAQQWQTLMFDHYFSMDQPLEVAVGYHITFKENSKNLIPVDVTESVPYYSDLVSVNGRDFASIASTVPGSWCISALAVHKRDLDAAKKNGVVDQKLLEGKMIRLSSNPITQKIVTSPIKNATLSTKEALKLKGFNVYRDDVKLNADILKTFAFTDSSVAENAYTYRVGAVYSNEEVFAEKYIEVGDLANEGALDGVSIALYPNPTTETINISGEYKSLKVSDLAGKTVLKFNTPKSSVDLSTLTPGTYLFNFTTKEGKIASYKVVIR